MQKIRISNSKNFNNRDFISASEVSVSISLFQLLSGQIHLSEFSAENAKISLVRKKDGGHNWSFDNIGGKRLIGRLSPADIAKTFLSFIRSSFHVPVRLIQERDIIKDDRRFCDTLFDRDYVTKIKALKEKQKQQETDAFLKKILVAITRSDKCFWTARL